MNAQLTRRQVAERLGITVKGVDKLRGRASLPAPDGYLGTSPWWWEATIDAWLPTRPPSGQPSHLWTPERRAAHSARLRGRRSAPLDDQDPGNR